MWENIDQKILAFGLIDDVPGLSHEEIGCLLLIIIMQCFMRTRLLGSYDRVRIRIK